MALCEKCRQRLAMSPAKQKYLDTHHKGWNGDIAQHKAAAKKGWATIRANKIKYKEEQKEAIENAKRIRESKYGK